VLACQGEQGAAGGDSLTSRMLVQSLDARVMPIVAATTMPKMIELTDRPNADTICSSVKKHNFFSMGLFVLVALTLVAGALGRGGEVRCLFGFRFLRCSSLLCRSRRHSRRSCKWPSWERGYRGGGGLPLFFFLP
jgi:hypothetical protein